MVWSRHDEVSSTMASRCVLGFAGEKCNPASSSSSSPGPSWYDTRIGGLPIWPELSKDSSIPAPCPRCSSPRFLVLQAYAPLHSHANRFILIFACNNIRCSVHSDTWLAKRFIQLNNNNKDDVIHKDNIPETKNNIEEINWDDDDDDDDEDDDDDDVFVEDLKNLSLMLEVKKQSGKQRIQKRNNQGPTKQIENLSHQCQEQPSFPSFYVEVDHEPASSLSSKSRTDEEKIQKLLNNYLGNEKINNENQQLGPEKEEEQTESEKALQNFRETIALAPCQILRYAFNHRNHPILPIIRRDDDNKFCKYCGRGLVFELQLLGCCLYYLDVDKHVFNKERNEAGMNFSSVVLYTCENDCYVVDSNQCNSFLAFDMSVEVIRDDW